MQLSEVNSANVLHTLRLRYEAGEIYTAIGPILVALNPFKPIELCGDDSMNAVSHAHRSYCSLALSPSPLTCPLHGDSVRV